MLRSRYGLIAGAAAGLLMLVAGTAAALNLDLQDGPIQPPTPSVPDPTDSANRLKEQEAARPTPTAVSSSSICPAQQAACAAAQAIVSAVQAHSTSALNALSRPLTIECPSEPLLSAPPFQPVCKAAGFPANGFPVAVFAKTNAFVDSVGFQQFVDGTLRGIEGTPELAALGCPTQEGALDCSSFLAIVIAGSTEDPVLILHVVFDGGPSVVGALRWASATDERRGGPVEYRWPLLPYKGPMYFQPVSLR